MVLVFCFSFAFAFPTSNLDGGRNIAVVAEMVPLFLSVFLLFSLQAEEYAVLAQHDFTLWLLQVG